MKNVWKSIIAVVLALSMLMCATVPVFAARTEEYISDLRIHYAKRLLKSGCSNISEVAARCGYTDRFYFSKIFKRETGQTPKEYRESAKTR